MPLRSLWAVGGAAATLATASPAWAQTSTLFGNFQTLLLNAVSTAIAGPMGNLLTYTGGAFLAFATVAITIYGIGIMMGRTDLIGFVGLRHIIRIAVIGLVLGAGGRYQAWVVQPWLIGSGGIPDSIVSAMSGTPGVQLVDRLWEQITRTTAALYDKISITDPGGSVFCAFAIIFILVIGVFCCAIVFVQVVLAQVGMAMVLMVGPLFMLTFMFDVTSRWGWAWAGEVIHYGVNYVLLAAAGLLVQGLIDAVVAKVTSSSTATAFAMLVPMAWLAIGLVVTVFVYLQASKIASAISAGSASDALRAVVGTAAGGRV